MAYQEELYRQIAAILRSRIGTEYPFGSRIPTEVDLAREFKVSLPTARRALASLVSEGYIVRRRGSGSYVRDSLPQGPVALLCEHDLSTCPHPFLPLRLLSLCQQTLARTGRESEVFLGHTPEGTSAPALPTAPGFLARANRFSAIISLSPVHLPPSLTNLPLIGPGGEEVRLPLDGFFRQIQKQTSETTRLFILRGKAPWLQTGTSRDFTPLPSPSGAVLPCAIALPDPGGLEQVRRWRQAFPPERRREISLFVTGWKGDPASPGTGEATLLNADPAILAQALVSRALGREPTEWPADLWR